MSIKPFGNLVLICLSLWGCRSSTDATYQAEACTPMAPAYPAYIEFPVLELPTMNPRIYISINHKDIEFDSCSTSSVPFYFESPVFLNQDNNKIKIVVALEYWQASDYLDTYNLPAPNPSSARAEVYLNSNCEQDPTIYKVIETNQFTWSPNYLNDKIECGIDSQKGIVLGDWE